MNTVMKDNMKCLTAKHYIYIYINSQMAKYLRDIWVLLIIKSQLLCSFVLFNYIFVKFNVTDTVKCLIVQFPGKKIGFAWLNMNYCNPPLSSTSLIEDGRLRVPPTVRWSLSGWSVRPRSVLLTQGPTSIMGDAFLVPLLEVSHSDCGSDPEHGGHWYVPWESTGYPKVIIVASWFVYWFLFCWWFPWGSLFKWRTMPAIIFYIFVFHH